MTKMCVFFCCGIVECVGKQFKVAELKKRNLNSLKKTFQQTNVTQLFMKT